MGSIVMEVFSKIIFLSIHGVICRWTSRESSRVYLSNLASITPGAPGAGAGQTPSEAELDLLSSSSAFEDPIDPLSTWFFGGAYKVCYTLGLLFPC